MLWKAINWLQSKCLKYDFEEDNFKLKKKTVFIKGPGTYFTVKILANQDLELILKKPKSIHGNRMTQSRSWGNE